MKTCSFTTASRNGKPDFTNAVLPVVAPSFTTKTSFVWICPLLMQAANFSGTYFTDVKSKVPSYFRCSPPMLGTPLLMPRTPPRGRDPASSVTSNSESGAVSQPFGSDVVMPLHRQSRRGQPQ